MDKLCTMPVDNLWITTYPHLWITYPQPVDNFSHGLTFFLKMCKYPYIGLSFAFLFFGGNKKPPADLTLAAVYLVIEIVVNAPLVHIS